MMRRGREGFCLARIATAITAANPKRVALLNVRCKHIARQPHRERLKSNCRSTHQCDIRARALRLSTYCLDFGLDLLFESGTAIERSKNACELFQDLIYMSEIDGRALSCGCASLLLNAVYITVVVYRIARHRSRARLVVLRNPDPCFEIDKLTLHSVSCFEFQRLSAAGRSIELGRLGATRDDSISRSSCAFICSRINGVAVNL